jgi:hypothetical protein
MNKPAKVWPSFAWTASAKVVSSAVKDSAACADEVIKRQCGF